MTLDLEMFIISLITAVMVKFYSTHKRYGAISAAAVLLISQNNNNTSLVQGQFNNDY